MTRIYKDHWKNWNAETAIDMPELGERRFLQINTAKRSNGALITNASVNKRTEYGYEHTFFKDFNERVASAKVSRCTDKVVIAQHNAAMEQIEQIKAAALAHYGSSATA